MEDELLMRGDRGHDRGGEAVLLGRRQRQRKGHIGKKGNAGGND